MYTRKKTLLAVKTFQVIEAKTFRLGETNEMKQKLASPYGSRTAGTGIFSWQGLVWTLREF